MNQQLTEKSDVFSFGIVLLEIICGREPINTALQDRNQWNIGEWVSRFFIFQDKNHKHFFWRVALLEISARSFGSCVSIDALKSWECIVNKIAMCSWSY